MTPNATVTAYIARQPSPQAQICRSLRQLITDRFPHMTEEYKWRFPAYYSDGKRICLASAFTRHVTLELFYGAQLDDSLGRVEGVGKMTRHIKLRSLADVDADYLADLLRQSIELSRVS
jgi:hypothetical protein